jgi:hypothetical protein
VKGMVTGGGRQRRRENKVHNVPQNDREQGLKDIHQH